MAEHPDLSALLKEFLSLADTPDTLPRRAELAAVLLPALTASLDRFRAGEGPEKPRQTGALLVATCATAMAKWGDLQADYRSLRQAIAGYDAALAVMSREAMPADWAKVHMNRANALKTLCQMQGGAEGAEALRQAIASYDTALSVTSREGMPADWAMVQMNRATALRILGDVLGGADGGEALRQAFDGYDAALSVMSREAMPAAWARVQVNRANGLLTLGQVLGGAAGGKALRQAIAGYDDALSVRSCEAMPTAWATAQMNRANALKTLGEVLGGAEGGEALRRAIVGYDAALSVRSREAMPAAWATAQMNRANALATLGEFLGGAEGGEALRQAIVGYDAALSVMSREAMPADWAAAQMGRANALLTLGQVLGGAEGGEALRQAIDGCDAALSVRSREAMPSAWATTQMNRATALASLGEALGGAEGREALRQAAELFGTLAGIFEAGGRIDHLLQAMKRAVRTRLLLQEWQDAAAIAQSALDRADEWLLAAVTAADGSERIGGLTGLGDMAAFALAQLGRPAEALLVAEAGRAYQLREHIRLAEARLDDAGRSALDARRRSLDTARRSLERVQGAWSLDEDNRRAAVMADTAERTEDLRREHEAYLALLDELGLRRTPPPPFDRIVKATATGTPGAIVTLAVTKMGTVALIARHGLTDPSQVIARVIPSFRSGDLDTLLHNSDVGGWLDGFFAFRNDIAGSGNRGSADGVAAWNARIADTLQRLWSGLMAPIDAALRDLGLGEGDEVSLIVPGRLSVLPLHAAGECDAAGRWTCLFDRWTVAYAPGVAALARVRSETTAEPARLLAVTDPTKNLHIHFNPAADAFADGQVEEYFHGEARRQKVRERLPGCDYASFVCHGTWSPADPDSSGLQMADGLLTPADIRAAGMERCRFAMLGACESGLASLRQTPDELQGLPAALLQAGVGAVAATFWPVYNLTAERVIADVFAAHRSAGLPPAAALRRVLQRLRDGAITVSDDEVPKAAAWVAAAPEPKTAPALPGPLSPLATNLSQPLHWAAVAVFGR